VVDYGEPESHVIVLTTWNHLIVTAKFPVEVFVIVSGPNVRSIYDYSAGFAIAMALQCPQIWLKKHRGLKGVAADGSPVFWKTWHEYRR
jgi:hypothetical protein